jgi:hypothetical protein
LFLKVAVFIALITVLREAALTQAAALAAPAPPAVVRPAVVVVLPRAATTNLSVIPMNAFGYLLLIGFLLLGAIVWSVKRRGKEVNVTEFWAEKEREFGEKKVLSSFARYLGGHPRFETKTEGLLYLMSRSLWFENFEKGPNIFGIAPPFEKVIFRIPLSSITAVEAIPEKELFHRDRSLLFLNRRRINQKPEYLLVRYRDEWQREREVYFDSMVELATWQKTIAETQKNMPPEALKEKPEAVGVCPNCGKKVSPDFKLCPYCGCKLS